MTVAVLGCGPSGLLAAHAAVRAGVDVQILSMYRPSPIGGAQFLHRAIPGITEDVPDGELDFIYVGDKEGYAKKVYGNPWSDTSWGTWEGKVPVWNLRRAYAKLWALYEELIVDTKLDYDRVLSVSRSYEFVFSTVPLSKICIHPVQHVFMEQPVWITDEGITGENSIVYNGLGMASWYRASSIFGSVSIEYSNPPLRESVRVVKPISNSCTCTPKNVVKLGRYGRWEKGVLTHHAYEGAENALQLV